MYPCTSWYYQLHICSKNNILMPSTTNHSYVKYKSTYSRHKDDKLRKKVAYQQLSIAGMQLFMLFRLLMQNFQHITCRYCHICICLYRLQTICQFFYFLNCKPRANSNVII